MAGRNHYHAGMKATVSQKGQVTIPKQLRDRLGIRTGEVLDFCDEGGRLVVTKVPQRDPVDDAWGLLELDQSVDAAVNELRGKADAA